MISTLAAATPSTDTVVSFARLRAHDTARAGGKGAHLGELASIGMPVPDGFVITAAAWNDAREREGALAELRRTFSSLDAANESQLANACERAVSRIQAIELDAHLREAISAARTRLLEGESSDAVIVRSSATLEDSAGASFAGMNETYANVQSEQGTFDAVRDCWASLFAPRTVFYRAQHDMPIADAQIAVVVQRYVPAVLSGIMFTADPASGDTNRYVIESAAGGGSAIVSGKVTPDRYIIDAPSGTIAERTLHAQQLRVVDTAGGGTHEEALSGDEQTIRLSDTQLHELAELGRKITAHYGRPQDIEWLIDPAGVTWIVQSRPLTALGAPSSTPTETNDATPLVSGIGACPGVATGVARILQDPAGATLAAGDVLVAAMTSPDWAPLMRTAAAIVTDAGGSTCHAAIVARELGVPCVVGTGTATRTLIDGQLVTVDGRAGTVHAGHRVTPTRDDSLAPARFVGAPATATRVLVNLSDVTQAERVARMDNDGVGLLRAETMLVDALAGTHPLELIEQGRADEAVEQLARAIGTFARAFAPRPVTYRTIDFRSNEFRRLSGGERHELVESNPMIGFRGAGRYAEQPELLELETRALAQVWHAGHTNIRVMLPFVRSVADVEGCLPVFERSGLLADHRFELWVMAEVPSVMQHLAAYQRLGIRGISIGTNDLTQLLLGVDRDSDKLTHYDATDPAVTAYLEELIGYARELGLHTSICGQAPAVHEGYAEQLVRWGIDSISVTPDALEATWRAVERAERALLLELARG